MKKKIIKKNLKIIFYSFTTLFITGSILIIIILLYFSRDLPKVSMLEEYKPSLVTRIYDINGEVIGEFFEEKRILVPLRKIPKHMVQALIATEDSEFYKHKGINFKGIFRAIVNDIIHMGAVQGGSSITQQLVKNIFLSREKTIARKIKEIMLSLQIEREYSKDEILEIYLNHIYFGSGAYGVEAASRVYFGKHIEDLPLEECAILAGLPRAPQNYSPYINIERSLARRNWVLHRMHQMQYINNDEYKAAAAEQIKLGKLETRINKAQYFNEYVRQFLEKKFGDKAIYQDGLKVYTTLDLRLQNKAEEEMKKCLEKTNEKVGAYKSVKFFKPIETLQQKNSLTNKQELFKALKSGDILNGKIIDANAKNAVVDLGYGIKCKLDIDSMKWAKRSALFKTEHGGSEIARYQVRKVSDIIKKDDLVRIKLREEKDKEIIVDLMQEQLVQGSLLCMDAQTGYIRAMVGGYDFIKTPFNRAVQAWRQPGSAFKPFIYTVGIDNKIFTPASIILDAPVTYLQYKRWIGKKLVDVLWKPENYHKTFNGEVSLRYSLAYSLNIPAIKSTEKIGTDKIIEFAHKIGLGKINNRNLSLALGTSEVTLQDLTAAFGIFANQGVKLTPMAIRYIEGNNGNLLDQYLPQETVVLNENTSYIMANVMESVIKMGTAKKAKNLNRPVAGKTGTTDGAVDAWFVGFTPEIVTGMYVGLDDRTSMGQHASGEELVVPYWVEFMQEAIKDTPPSSFIVPDDVTFLDIDPKTGLLAGNECQEIIREVFLKGTEPQKICDKHKGENNLNNKIKFDLTSLGLDIK
ncbi:PBP1A family penicillin-binding protein [Candidatus Poribacteria bacterium]|nr:PBP1A family penicillin-binding protein [Candidatus Poribacteria bacterium]